MVSQFQGTNIMVEDCGGADLLTSQQIGSRARGRAPERGPSFEGTP